jgi:hypothetical protein
VSFRLFFLSVYSDVSIVSSTAVFWDSEILVGEATPFQLCLHLSDAAAFAGRAFASLAIHMSGKESGAALVIHHDDIDTPGPVQYLEVGDLSKTATSPFTANLDWEPGSWLVVAGSVSGTIPSTHEVWLVVAERDYQPLSSVVHQDSPHSQGRRLVGRASTSRIENQANREDTVASVNPSTQFCRHRSWCRYPLVSSHEPLLSTSSEEISIRQRPYELQVELKHDGPAYVGEKYAITAQITNTDIRTVRVIMDVLLHPTDADNAGQFMPVRS